MGRSTVLSTRQGPFAVMRFRTPGHLYRHALGEVSDILRGKKKHLSRDDGVHKTKRKNVDHVSRSRDHKDTPFSRYPDRQKKHDTKKTRRHVEQNRNRFSPLAQRTTRTTTSKEFNLIPEQELLQQRPGPKRHGNLLDGTTAMAIRLARSTDDPPLTVHHLTLDFRPKLRPPYDSEDNDILLPPAPKTRAEL